ncbi:MAG: S8 family serine peptidase [Leptospiraceae bacterium]|nr:S8 family serine peptidase [Leptospiraceae bacterium]MCP5497179.1 S8 family serine peptidase [Leptospiraceae bacterium]
MYGKIKKFLIIGIMIFAFFYSCGGGSDGLSDEELFGLWWLLNQQNTAAAYCKDISRPADTGEDALYSYQWHLNNSPNDLNLQSVWSSSIKGNNVLVAVVDDGLEISHEDLKSNVLTSANKNFWTTTSGYSSSETDPTPTSSNSHGTSVAGTVGALDNNSVGVRGVAPRVCLAGYNLIARGSYTTTEESTAMTHNSSAVGVSNNSWGPTDYTGELYTSNATWRDAIESGLSTGRDNKGTLYVWAAGNGAISSSTPETDNSNYDGYANYRGVVAVCALLNDGTRAKYSEQGANLWTCGYADKTTYSESLTTTDLTGSSGANSGSSSSNLSDSNYTNQFNGTSAASPTVAGVIALILEKNSALTWRDVKLILAESARKNDSSDSDWTTNSGSKINSSGNYNINHKYGFGAVDADTAVTLASNWTNVASEESAYTYPTDGTEKSVGTTFSDNNSTGVSDSITISGTTIKKIEFIEVYLTATSTIDDMDVRLKNGNGTESVLASYHTCRNSSGTSTTCSSTFSSWRFGTARHLGEDANQTWTLTVSDRNSGNVSGGTFTSWKIKFYGRAQ